MILAYLAFAWLLGVAAAAFSGSDPPASIAAAFLLASLSFAWRPRARTLIPVTLAIIIVLAAGWRYETSPPKDGLSGIAVSNETGAIRFRARVDAEPEAASSGSVRYRLKAEQLLTADNGWRQESGMVLMATAPFPRYRYGDRLEIEGKPEIEGKLTTPPTFTGFDYRAYLERRGIQFLVYYPAVTVLAHDQGSTVQAAVIRLRDRLQGALAGVLPQPQAALAGGILLGQRGAIPGSLRDAMNTTGTSHLTAVSGQNITLLAGLIIGSLAWLVGRRQAALLALAAMIGYALLVGGQAPVLRATVMGSLWIIAIVLGRQRSGLQPLLLAAAGMTAYDPQLAKDVSFQLSFSATAGLIVMSPLLIRWLQAAAGSYPTLAEAPLLRPIIEMTAVTVSAIAFTLPISAIAFQRISLVAPIANLFAVPAFVAVAACALLASVAATVIPGLSPYLVWVAWPPAAYMTAVIEFFAGLPFAALTLDGFGLGHAAAWFAVLAALLWALSAANRNQQLPSVAARPSRSAIRPWPLPAAGIALLLALSGIAGALALAAPDSGRLSVTFLDVGQGDSILIRSPAGHTILVDGGPSGEAALAALARHTPPDQRRIDLMILTHPQADHMTGLVSVLERYEVEEVMAPPLAGAGAGFAAWQQAVRAEGARYTEVSRGGVAPLGQGTSLEILNPPPELLDGGDLNQNALVIRLRMGSFSLLLTADIAASAEEALIDWGPDLASTALQLPHHGSRTSASPQFLRQVAPFFSIVSVGADNPFGHPAPQTLARLGQHPVFRTDLSGDITLATDGRRLWVQTQKAAR